MDVGIGKDSSSVVRGFLKFFLDEKKNLSVSVDG